MSIKPPLVIVALETIHCPIPEFQLSDTNTYILQSHFQSRQEDVASRIRDADIVLTTTCPINAFTLEPDMSPRLKLVIIMAAGTDCVDLDVCKKRAITVVNCPGANMNSVAEHAIGLYFATRRSTALLHNSILKSRWVGSGCLLSQMRDGNDKPPLSAESEVLGILGYGKIGKRIGAIAKSMGMRVLVADRKGVQKSSELSNDGVAERLSFVEVLQESTVVVVIVPLLPVTQQLIAKPEFELMRPDSILINLSRGGVVDEDALIESLQLGVMREQGGISGAAVDVFETEPASKYNSVLVKFACEAEQSAAPLNLTLTPHIAWYNDMTVRRLQAMTKASVEGWIDQNIEHTIT